MSARSDSDGAASPATVVWSTDGVAPGERFAFWREAVCDAFLELAPETSTTLDFSGSIVLQQRSAISVALISADAQRVDRPRAPDGGWCYLNVQVAGTARTVQGDTMVATSPGDSVLLRTDRPFSFELDERFVQYSVRLPETFCSRFDGPVLLPRQSSVGRAAASLVALTGLHDPVGRSTPDDLGNWLDQAIISLSDEIVGVAELAAPMPPRAALWAAIDADIDQHLHVSRLSPADTARRVGLSVRSLHHVFDERPLTYAREVKRRRLDRAHAMLNDPRFDGLRIRDIAVDCGFDDAQHFQRVFRGRFHETPGNIRRDRRGRFALS